MVEMAWRRRPMLQAFPLTVFIQGLALLSVSVHAGLPFPEPTVVCSITITGDITLQRDVWTPSVISIGCSNIQEPGKAVNVAAGKQLHRYIHPTGNNGPDGSSDYASPPNYGGGGPPYYGGPSYGWTPSSTPLVTLAIYGIEVSAPPTVNGWSFTFLDAITHLSLVNSVIAGVPLSFDPLISCPSCEYITISNVTVQDLHGKGLAPEDCPSDGPENLDNPEMLKNRTVGALHFAGVREASVDYLSCSNVNDATDFACLWLSLLAESDDNTGHLASADGDGAAGRVVRISNSMFVNNSVTAGNCFKYTDTTSGFGAVMVHAPYPDLDPNSRYDLRSIDIFNTTMSNNKGGHGSSLVFYGDQLDMHVDILQISNSSLVSNEAKLAGAILLNMFCAVGTMLITQSSRIDNNIASGPSGSGSGGAVYLARTIVNLIVNDSSSISGNVAASFGGAFFLEHGLDEFSILGGSNMSLNSAGDSGGAVHMLSESSDRNASIRICNGSHVDHNSAGKSGGAFNTRVNMRLFLVGANSTVDYNTAGKSVDNLEIVTDDMLQGGALCVSNEGVLHSLVITDGSSMSFNQAPLGGGAVFVQKDVTDGILIEAGSRVNNNVIAGRYAKMGGGIAVSGNCSFLIVQDRSSISGNIVSGNANGLGVQGGGIWIGGLLQKLVVTGSSHISWNLATEGASAIGVGMFVPEEMYSLYLEMDLVEVSNNSCICNNTASTQNIMSSYGAMYFQRTRVANFTITDGSCICDNKVPSGAGMGGAVYADRGFGNFTVCHSSGLSRNLGGNGGALNIPDIELGYNTNGSKRLALEKFELCADSHMDGNEARISGGAMLINGPVGQIVISNSSISDNRAHVTGGAIHLLAMFQSFFIIDSTLNDNTADFGQGGFVHLMVVQDDGVSGMSANCSNSGATRQLPCDGPFYFNITRSTVSGNSAKKDGGAVSINLQHWMTTYCDDTKRSQLQKIRVLYISIAGSVWDKNWAHYGAGGALAFLSFTPHLPSEQRMASVLMGGQINIQNTTFSMNTAGDVSVRLVSTKDVSPLQGNGGALFAWAAPYVTASNSGKKLRANQTAYEMYEDTSGCDEAEGSLFPGVEAFGNVRCFPKGSQACGVRMDGVLMTGNMAIGGYGGGLLLAQCAAKIADSTLHNNTASLDGGGFAFMDYDIPSYVLQPIYVRTTASSSSDSSIIGVLPYPPAPSPSQPLNSSAPPPQPPPALIAQSSGLEALPDDQTFGTPTASAQQSVVAGGYELRPSLEALQNLDLSRPMQQPWLVMQRTSFVQNSATNGGGAFLEVNATAAVVLDCNFQDNHAETQGGGVMLIGASTFAQVTAILHSTIFEGNEARVSGGGLAVKLAKSRAAAVLLNGTFKGNSAIRGGGIFNSGVRGITLLAWDCLLQGNTANYGGGTALDYIVGGPVMGSTNSSGLRPPSPRPPSPAPAPPRPPRPPPPPPPIKNIAAFTPTTAIVNFLKCQLIKNQALVNGGAINLLATDNKQNVLALMEQSTLSRNSAALGGAIYLNATKGCIMRISNCSISNNSAQLQGGGAYSTTRCGGQLLVGNGSFWMGNSALLYGGAIMANSGDAVIISSSANVTDISGAGSSSSSQSSICSQASLNISSSIVTSNWAQRGGGIYASQETAIMVTGTTMVNNSALQFGGAVAAVNCNLLDLINSSISDNSAAFSGGGIFNDKCVIFVMELGGLTGNFASTGGGLHIAGSRRDVMTAYGNSSISKRRRLQVTDNQASDDSPVAILSHVEMSGNSASVGFDQLIATSSVSIPSASNEYLPYQGHGGALFISGHAAVAVSGSTAGVGNSANVGTVVATTQVCSLDSSAGAKTSSSNTKTAAEKVVEYMGAGNWKYTVQALSEAAVKHQCSLLVLSETKLHLSPSPAPIELQQASQAKSMQLPLLWLQDLSASALLANCSSLAGSRDAEQLAIAQLVQQYLESSGNTTLPDSSPTEAIDSSDYHDMLPALVRMLQPCGDNPVSSNSHGPMALAVPATHMRLISFSGLLLVPAKNRSLLAQQPNNIKAASDAAYLVDMAAEQQYLTGIGSDTAFRGKDIEALVITPNTYFNLDVQLYDGLGQAVVVDTPSFLVSLSIRPHTGSLVLQDDKFISLRGNNVSSISTSSGVASWTGLELLGWPGQYLLEASAVIKGATVNTALPTIAPLLIPVELLPCEVGYELSMVEGNSAGSIYSCSPCRRDQVGLWRDQRTPLTELISRDANQASSTVTQTMRVQNQNLTSSNDNDDTDATCPSCCLSCPANAICPGGSLMIPAPGYWHSSPNSPRMHRCPQPTACGKTEAFGDELDAIWGKTLRSNFNISNAGVQNVTINITDPSALSIVSMSPGLMTMSLETPNMVSLRNDNRSFLLSVCQEWWLKTFPPNRDIVLQHQYNISPHLSIPTAPCYLSYDPSFSSSLGSEGNERSYEQLQCATGYTGHLCATCVPGYSLGVDFSCMKCPSLYRTVSVGLLAFFGTVALILFTTFSNLSRKRAEMMEFEELSSLDLLKTLITHVQYFIIITKLGINYPPIITKFQGILTSLTGSENFIAYSPSCLFKDFSSDGQAASQVGFGLLAPCMATLVSLVVWVIRYLAANQSLLRRVKAARWTHSPALGELFVHQELSPLPSSIITRESGLSPTNSKASKIITSAGLSPTNSKARNADGRAAHSSVNGSQAVAMKADSRAAAHGLRPSAAKQAETSGLNPPASMLECPPFNVATRHGVQQLQQQQHSAETTKHELPPELKLALSPPLGHDAEATLTPATAAAAAAAVSVNNAEVSIQVDGPAMATADLEAGSLDDGGDGGSPALRPPVSQTTSPTATTTVIKSSSSIEALQHAVAVMQRLRRVNSAQKNHGNKGTVASTALMVHASAVPAYGTENQPVSTGIVLYPAAGSTSPANGAAAPGTAAGMGNGIVAGSDGMRWGPTPFALDVRLDEDTCEPEVDGENDGKAQEGGCEAWSKKLSQWVKRYSNPLHLLVFADQAVSLRQQLVVVIIVASFILYPALCQISLSMFACYKLDSGTGAFSENQQANWPRGYWVRDMQQECYWGLHRRVYVPIGITAVLLFCFSPPIVYFLLTVSSRCKFQDPRVRIQYGFLYQQYKPQYFWWASMRQLQVLGLVAVEVFGRALPVKQQALMLLSVLIMIAAVNTSSSPERFPALMILEFLSMCVLSLTLTLGLYFVGGDGEAELPETASNAVGAIILTINAVYIVGVLFFSVKQNAGGARHMRKLLSSSWGHLKTSVSRVIVRVEQRLSLPNSGRSLASGRASNASVITVNRSLPESKASGGSVRRREHAAGASGH